MIKRLLFILIAVILAFAVYVALIPGEFSVERSAAIAAPPEAVFKHVNNLKKWDDWSPWAKRDPNAKTHYEGPEEGPGTVLKWDGDEEVGKGQMTIIESTPSERIAIKLEFERPFPGSSDVGFAFSSPTVMPRKSPGALQASKVSLNARSCWSWASIWMR